MTRLRATLVVALAGALFASTLTPIAAAARAAEAPEAAASECVQPLISVLGDDDFWSDAPCAGAPAPPVIV